METKRHRRTLPAVINGIGVAEAIRQHLIEPHTVHDAEGMEVAEDGNNSFLFIPEQKQQNSSFVAPNPTPTFGTRAQQSVTAEMAKQQTVSTAVAKQNTPGLLTIQQHAFGNSQDLRALATSGTLGSTTKSTVQSGASSTSLADSFAQKSISTGPDPPAAVVPSLITFGTSGLNDHQFGSVNTASVGSNFSTTSAPAPQPVESFTGLGQPSTAPFEFGASFNSPQNAQKQQAQKTGMSEVCGLSCFLSSMRIRCPILTSNNVVLYTLRSLYLDNCC